jgi:hypothetical protein
MTLISAVKTFMATFPSLESGALILTDHIGAQPIQYSIQPLPGQRIVEQYIDGVTVREFPFVFQTVKSTADELERIETSGFLEALMDWFEQKTIDGELPALAANQTARTIEAVSWGFLYEQGVSDTGIYQIVVSLRYGQTPITATPEDTGA